jgi:hypothetical protein
MSDCHHDPGIGQATGIRAKGASDSWVMAVQAGDPFVAQQPENMAMLTPDEQRQAVTDRGRRHPKTLSAIMGPDSSCRVDWTRQRRRRTTT